MKKCPFCGAVNSDNSKTCYSCNENIDFEVSEERKNFESGKNTVFSNRKKEEKSVPVSEPLPKGCFIAIEIVVAATISGIITNTFKLGAIPAVIIMLVSIAIGEVVANFFNN